MTRFTIIPAVAVAAVLAAGLTMPRSAAAQANDVYAYPLAGQNTEQQSRDRFECHQWGVQQSGFDPYSAPPPPQQPTQQQQQGGTILGLGQGGLLPGTGLFGDAATGAGLVDAGFLARMRRLGVTTVEAKSGYGLNEPDELKTLRVYRRLREEQPLEIVGTFLGAHVVPPEFAEDRAGYLRLLTDELMPRIAETARALWLIYLGFTLLEIALLYGLHLGGLAPPLLVRHHFPLEERAEAGAEDLMLLGEDAALQEASY